MFLNGGIFTIDACSFYASIFTCGVKIGAWPDLNGNCGLRLTVKRRKASIRQGLVLFLQAIRSGSAMLAKLWFYRYLQQQFRENQFGKVAWAVWGELLLPILLLQPEMWDIFVKALIILSLECIFGMKKETEPCQFVPPFDRWQQQQQKRRQACWWRIVWLAKRWEKKISVM